MIFSVIARKEKMTEAIERLKNRQRKKVNARNSSLTENNQTANESNNNDLLTESSQIINESNNNDLLTESSQTTNESSNNDLLTKSSQTINLQAEPIRRTIRLDPIVDEYMDTLCKENRVTRETLIEAAILICGKNQRTLNKVITDAKDRYQNRKRVGELKKLQTMSRKLGFNK